MWKHEIYVPESCWALLKTTCDNLSIQQDPGGFTLIDQATGGWAKVITNDEEIRYEQLEEPVKILVVISRYDRPYHLEVLADHMKRQGEEMVLWTRSRLEIV